MIGPYYRCEVVEYSYDLIKCRTPASAHEETLPVQVFVRCNSLKIFLTLL